jgi:hypothetical protein
MNEEDTILSELIYEMGIDESRIAGDKRGGGGIGK